MKHSLIKQLALAVDARDNCLRHNGNGEWFDRWTDRLHGARNVLPSGSGFDAGSTVDVGRSRADRIVLNTSFHHMNEYGSYDGWTEHDVIVTPSLVHGFTLRVTGRNRNDIKEYIAQTFQYTLEQPRTRLRMSDQPNSQERAAQPKRIVGPEGYVMGFLRAVYGENAELAAATFNEKTALLDATQRIYDLAKALRERKDGE